MKHLTILRHAKTAQAVGNQADVDRPLLEKGYRQIKHMAPAIRSIAMKPDRILSSPALRAAETAEQMAAAIHYEQGVVLDKRIYEAAPTTLLEILREQATTAEHVLLIGHNPGLAMLMSGICSGDDSRLNVEFPPAGVAYLTLDVMRWRQVRWGCGSLQFLLTPRSIKKYR